MSRGVTPVRRLSRAAISGVMMIAMIGVALSASRLPAAEQQAAPQPSAAQLMDDLMWNRGPIGGPFALTDHTGKLRTDAEFRGKLLVIYFGYTYCPDICPTDLMAISSALDLLGRDGETVQPIFISIDPERDTLAHLADYVAAFHPRLLGLTGAPDAIRKVATAYKAYYDKAENAPTQDYVIDHTAFIYLLGRDGRYLGFLPPGTSPERLGEVIRGQLSR